MIDSITSSSKYLIVNNYESSIYIDMSRPSAGMLRLNGSTIEVYDGLSWVVLRNGTVNINLGRDAESLLDWVREKKQEEQKDKELREKYPTLNMAYEKYMNIKSLVKDDFEIQND